MATILSVSLPPELRSTLDAEVRRQRRPRSAVVADAVRDYVARQQREAFSTAHRQTLRDGLSLTPPARLALSEELWQDFARGQKPVKPWTETFSTFSAYDAWRRAAAERVR